MAVRVDKYSPKSLAEYEKYGPQRHARWAAMTRQLLVLAWVNMYYGTAEVVYFFNGTSAVRPKYGKDGERL